MGTNPFIAKETPPVAGPDSDNYYQVIGNYIENAPQGIDVHVDHAIVAHNIVNNAFMGMKAMHGARNVIITTEQGCVALLREERAEIQRFRAVAPRIDPVSAVGSGDVLLAAYVAARHAGRTHEESLRAAVAAGTASTLEVGAGRFDPRQAGRLQAGVELSHLEPVEAA